jgi:hypothetical protein
MGFCGVTKIFSSLIKIRSFIKHISFVIYDEEILFLRSLVKLSPVIFVQVGDINVDHVIVDDVTNKSREPGGGGGGVLQYVGVHRRTAGMGILLDQSNISMGCNFHQSVISMDR